MRDEIRYGGPQELLPIPRQPFNRNALALDDGKFGIAGEDGDSAFNGERGGVAIGIRKSADSLEARGLQHVVVGGKDDLEGGSSNSFEEIHCEFIAIISKHLIVCLTEIDQAHDVNESFIGCFIDEVAYPLPSVLPSDQDEKRERIKGQRADLLAHVPSFVLLKGVQRSYYPGVQFL
jgi:hypothetical protein